LSNKPVLKKFQGYLESMTTDELNRIWKENEQTSRSEQIFELISEVLTKRNSTIPNRTKFQRKSLKLPTESNALVEKVAPKKLEITFKGEDGYLCSGQSNFKNKDELKAYLAGAFLTDDESSGFGASIKRCGKYCKTNKSGDCVTALGDPILDLITDEQGITYISGKMFDLKLGHATAGRGGISSTDLKTEIANIRQYHPTDSVSGNAGFTLGGRNGKVTTLASSNPEIWFYEEGTNNKMRFRTFRHNRGLWKSLGCEIETWGGSDAHFKSARIDSWYGWAAIGCCTYAKYDNDSDTNDDFVDEYEVATFGASLPDGVNSYCTANWRNTQKDGRVWDFCQCVAGQE
jgi:hypothetical protein